MTARDFAYWLQGFFEINEGCGGVKALTETQTEMIRKHLDLVFKMDESIKPLRTDLPAHPNPVPGAAPGIIPSPISYPQPIVNPFPIWPTTIIC